MQKLFGHSKELLADKDYAAIDVMAARALEMLDAIERGETPDEVNIDELLGRNADVTAGSGVETPPVDAVPPEPAAPAATDDGAADDSALDKAFDI